MSAAPRSPWPQVGLLYACGLLAAVQLGKLSALAPLVAQSLALPLTTVALAMSIVELGGASLGVVAGVLAGRLGLVRVLLAGVAALALAGFGGAAGNGVVALFGWRLLEAAGYLAVIVSAPVLIARCSAGDRHTQALAMTLWSTFVPVGFALGAWASGWLGSHAGWRSALLLWGALAAVLLLALWRALEPAQTRPGQSLGAPSAATPAQGGAPLPRPVLALVLGFGLFALFEIGLLGMLPTLLVRQAGLSAAAAGGWTALASASAVAGSAVAALLIRRGHGLQVPALLSLALPPLLLFGAFHEQPDATLAIALALVINVLGGIFGSLAFALLPRLAGSEAAMVKANGWLAQCGASGSLLGPPAMAACVQAAGWAAAAWFGLVVSLLALPLVAWALRHPAARS